MRHRPGSSTFCEKGKRKGSTHSEMADGESATSNAVPVESKRIRRASDSESAVPSESVSSRVQSENPSNEMDRPSTSRPNSDTHGRQAMSEGEPCTSTSQERELRVNSSEVPEETNQQLSGSNTRVSGNTEGRSRRQTTSEVR